RAQPVQPGLRHHLLFMAGSALALLTLLALLRLALLLFNRELLGDASLATLLEGFGNGLRFDLRVLVYIFVPLSLAVLSPTRNGRAQPVQPGLRHHLLFMAGSALALLTLLALLRLA
ncbi:hypothetical protein, partial [Haemophilus influenzae]|uniref:hypothetical protein n=1 Tax=Haemophilus influenzae TaxID=727 RepID=UPI0018E2CA6D